MDLNSSAKSWSSSPYSSWFPATRARPSVMLNPLIFWTRSPAFHQPVKKETHQWRCGYQGERVVSVIPKNDPHGPLRTRLVNDQGRQKKIRLRILERLSLTPSEKNPFWFGKNIKRYPFENFLKKTYYLAYPSYKRYVLSCWIIRCLALKGQN